MTRGHYVLVLWNDNKWLEVTLKLYVLQFLKYVTAKEICIAVENYVTAKILLVYYYGIVHFGTME